MKNDYNLNAEAAIARMTDYNSRVFLTRTTRPGDDYALDEFLSLSDEDFDRVYNEMFPSLNLRLERLSERDHSTHRQAISMIVANAMVSQQLGQRCHYSRSHRAYEKASVYTPSWITTEMLPREVTRLATAGFLIHTTSSVR